MPSRAQLKSWYNLQTLAVNSKSLHMKDLFDEDPSRAEHFSMQMPHIFLDYSKNRIDESIFIELMNLTDEIDLASWREKMFSGERINKTEDRSVLHTALRDRSGQPLMVDNVNVTEQVGAALERIKDFSHRVRCGEWKGYSGKRITDIVSIGVGGSNLGPQMVTEALVHFSDDTLNVHYVSNVDATQIAEALRPLNPENVLFIVSSKTFTTVETMTNARTAVHWLKSVFPQEEAIASHFVAVSANKKASMEFGIEEQNIFDMWDWVGGRFSLWSAIGLPIALYLGYEKFLELLEGAYEMDRHFCEAPKESNGPLILALISVWNTTFLNAQSQAILPYDQSLHMLSSYLQQAEMESNGKSVSMDGDEIDYPTVPGIWGGLGINGQHAFYQYLHQSNNIVPADFIGSVKSNTPIEGHHETLMANFFAQTQALMLGVDEEQVRADLKAKGRNQEYIDHVASHKVHKGNRPTNTLLMEQVSPRSLGALIALYEHKIFCQGIILNICSFDQWGVELGKGLASEIETELQAEDISAKHDSSTRNLIHHYKAVQKSMT